MPKIIAYILFLAVNLAPQDADRIRFAFFEEITWVKQDKTTWLPETPKSMKAEGAWTVKGTVVTFPYEGQSAAFDVSKLLALPSSVDWKTVSEIGSKETPVNPIRITRGEKHITLSQNKAPGGESLFPRPIIIVWEKSKE